VQNDTQSDMGTMEFAKQPAEISRTLLEYLLEEFDKSGPRNEPAYAVNFVKWADNLLAGNRPVRTFAVTGNVGLTLRNNESMLVAPPIAGDTGEMLKTPLDPRQRQGIPDEIADQGAIPISGFNINRQRTGVDYSAYDQANFRNSGGVKDDKRQPTLPEDRKQNRGSEL